MPAARARLSVNLSTERRVSSTDIVLPYDDVQDMFELGDYAHEVSTDIAPLTVALSEPARTLENILPFFYDDFPDVDDLPFQEVLDAFEAGAKYGMNLVEHIYAARLRCVPPNMAV